MTQKLNSVSLSGTTTSPEPSATAGWLAAGRQRRRQRKGQFRNKDSKVSPCLQRQLLPGELIRERIQGREAGISAFGEAPIQMPPPLAHRQALLTEGTMTSTKQKPYQPHNLLYVPTLTSVTPSAHTHQGEKTPFCSIPPAPRVPELVVGRFSLTTFRRLPSLGTVLSRFHESVSFTEQLSPTAGKDSLPADVVSTCLSSSKMESP